MSKQVIRLCRLQLTNLFGINELLYTKDRAKKMRFIGLSLVWFLVIAMVVLYVGAFSCGLAILGMADIVPMYLYAVASLLILVFSFFKAGSTLFAMKGYEMMVSLPVSRAAVIVSRFLCMYLMNLLMGLLIMLPGLVCYGYFVRPSAGFYAVFLLGSLFLPLLPLTVSSILGAVITAVSSRSRHKSLIETVLMMAVVVGVLGVSLFLPGEESQITEEIFRNLAETLSQQIGSLYPPSVWFADALSGDAMALCMMIGVPTVIFAVFVLILQKYFQRICAAIHAVTTKNDYQMTHLQKSSHVVALWRRELKRYFSSSVYVTNTLVGYVMAVIASAAICFMGLDRMVAYMGLPGVGAVIVRCLPYGLSCLLCMTSITACSISMEGNTFWQVQTLPVTAKDFYDSKILANLSVAVPFYVLSVILLIVAVRPTGFSLVWLVVLPAGYVLFSCVIGITINLLFPVLNWEQEVRVVKQSASMLVSMLIGILSAVLPLGAMMFVGEAWSGLIYFLTFAILLIVTFVLYIRNRKVELIKISER